MSSRCILILGGSRSGKSAFAQRLAGDAGKNVLFVATAEAGDVEMARRISAHRKSRPKHWRTLEVCRNVGKHIERTQPSDVVLIDCVTMLVSNLILQRGKEETVDDRKAALSVKRELGVLLNCFDRLDATFILVSNEVGLGLVPPYPLGRVYRDLLGDVNQRIASRADEVYMMTAGIPVRLK